VQWCISLGNGGRERSKGGEGGLRTKEEVVRPRPKTAGALCLSMTPPQQQQLLVLVLAPRAPQLKR
jgi:hypothetical protein